MTHTLISNQVKCTVQVRFDAEISDVLNNEFAFVYTITLHNIGRRTIQVLKRQWKIRDSLRDTRTVRGTGMNGVKTILSPDGQYSYEACVSIRSECGNMGGFFQMLDMGTDTTFPVLVPDFQLLYPFREN
jgi:ApaG protein